MEIKIKYFTDIEKIKQIPNGDWVDLRSAVDITLKKGEFTIIPLGVGMKLPFGYEARIVPRSSTYKNFGVLLSNSQGVIDNCYKGDNDQWFANMIAFRDTTIHKGDRICQFRIQLSQKATFWQKLRHLFSNGVEIKIVNTLGNPDRKGHGSTGIH